MPPVSRLDGPKGGGLAWRLSLGSSEEVSKGFSKLEMDGRCPSGSPDSPHIRGVTELGSFNWFSPWVSPGKGLSGIKMTYRAKLLVFMQGRKPRGSGVVWRFI